MNETLNSLAEKKDEELVKILQENGAGANESFDILSNRHSGICVQMYKKYMNPINPIYSGCLIEDAIDAKNSVLFDSAKKFDPNKGSKFSTWLANQMRFHCLETLKENGKTVSLDSEKSFFNENLTAMNAFKEQELAEGAGEILDFIRQKCEELSDEQTKHIIRTKYFGGGSRPVSHTEIAKNMDITIQWVSVLHDRFIEWIKPQVKTRFCN